VVANDRGVRSVRYHFSNRSEDIIGLFTAALDHLEIPLDAVRQVHRFDLPQSRHRAHGRVHWAEGHRGTVD
jgi:hypothetical protein